MLKSTLLYHNKLILKYIDVEFAKINRLIKTCNKSKIVIGCKYVAICDIL